MECSRAAERYIYSKLPRVTARKSLTFQMTTMVETLQLEDMGKPPLDALFCILCRGTILFPNVKLIFPNHHFQFGTKHSSVFLRKQHFFVSRNWQKKIIVSMSAGSFRRTQQSTNATCVLSTESFIIGLVN